MKIHAIFGKIFILVSRNFLWFACILFLNILLDTVFTSQISLALKSKPEFFTSFPATFSVQESLYYLLAAIIRFCYSLFFMSLTCYGIVHSFRSEPLSFSDAVNLIWERFPTAFLLWLRYYGIIFVLILIIAILVLLLKWTSIPFLLLLWLYLFTKVSIIAGLSLTACLSGEQTVRESMKHAHEIYYATPSRWKIFAAYTGYILLTSLLSLFIPSAIRNYFIQSIVSCLLIVILQYIPPFLYCLYHAERDGKQRKIHNVYREDIGRRTRTVSSSHHSAQENPALGSRHHRIPVHHVSIPSFKHLPANNIRSRRRVPNHKRNGNTLWEPPVQKTDRDNGMKKNIFPSRIKNRKTESNLRQGTPLLSNSHHIIPSFVHKMKINHPGYDPFSFHKSSDFIS